MTAQNAEQVAIAFGENIKAQMAAKAMFQLVHTHGDILREVSFSLYAQCFRYVLMHLGNNHCKFFVAASLL